jgi:hypothetical protein
MNHLSEILTRAEHNVKVYVAHILYDSRDFLFYIDPILGENR